MAKMIKDFVQIHANISNIPSVTYFEQPLLNYIYKHFPDENYKKIFNETYIAYIPKGYKKNILITVHIDRLGIIFQKDFIYSNYYGYKLNNKKYKPNLAFGERFKGELVCAYDYEGRILDEGEVIDCWVDQEESELKFSIKGLSLENCDLPIPFGYKNNIKLENDELKGQIDNTLGVALSYILLSKNINCIILFTTLEEIGKSWEFIYEFMKEHNLTKVIALDTSSVENLVNFEKTDVVFRVSDSLATFDEIMIQNFVNVAKKRDLGFYLKSNKPDDNVMTITEVGHIIKESGNEYSGATIQFPTIHYHTNKETVKIKSIESIYFILIDFFTLYS